MSLSQRVCKTLGMLCLAVPALAFGQASYVRQAAEYAPGGHLPGDQVQPSISLNSSGGYIVWQDNITDGDGLGISAVRLDASLSAQFGVQRVNQQGVGDQENPQVAMLNNGGAVFVWQGGPRGQQHIYARFLSSGNTWVTGDIMVNTATNFFQTSPVVTTLNNGNVVVSWSSYGQDGSMQGIYAQQLNSTGAKIATEFSVNQYTSYNQRTPAVGALANGGFVISWVSEQERKAATTSAAASVDIYLRLYNASGAPVSGEILANTSTNVCANPSVAGAADGSFYITWSQLDTVFDNSWDIYGRMFSSAGVGGAAQRINTQQYGDQYGPRIRGNGSEYMVVWTSLAQDGSAEGVFGQFLYANGSFDGGEFRVNSTTLNQQMQPAIASDGAKRFLAVWTGFTSGVNSFDIFAQRYATFQQPLVAPDKPFVLAISSSRLTVTWPIIAGFNVDHYELYIDGASTPVNITTNIYTLTGLAPSSPHTFRLAYVLGDGRHSPISATATGMTWGEDNNADGLPDDWQAAYWGSNPANWPPSSTLLAPGGPTVLQAFQSGSNPKDTNTWFVVKTLVTPQGDYLVWNTQPGCIYQVMYSSQLPPVWTLLSSSTQFASGTNASMFIGKNPPGTIQLYKVSRLRYN
jgi:hypothetical protein